MIKIIFYFFSLCKLVSFTPNNNDDKPSTIAPILSDHFTRLIYILSVYTLKISHMFKEQLAKEVATRRTFAIISHPNIYI